MAFHYTLVAIYALFWLLTVWSFIVAKWADPGFVPQSASNYEMASLSKREQILWQHVERLGQDSMDHKEFTVT